jgi:hypothetical protein
MELAGTPAGFNNACFVVADLCAGKHGEEALFDLILSRGDQALCYSLFSHHASLHWRTQSAQAMSGQLPRNQKGQHELALLNGRSNW